MFVTRVAQVREFKTRKFAMAEAHRIKSEQEALEAAKRVAKQIRPGSAVRDKERWKYHAVGNYYLNDVAPPRHAWL
jgi:hypothetical protein